MKELFLYVTAANQQWSTQALAQPVAGSAFESACKLVHGRTAFDFARIHFAGAEDHLYTMAAIFLAGKVPIFGGLTVLRGTLEASARACWLLDPKLSQRQRQERGFTERLNHLQGLQKFQREREDARAKIVRLRAQATAAGLDEKVSKEHKKSPPALLGFGIVRPKMTDLLLQLLPHRRAGIDADAEGQFLYRLVSGSAHSEPWAILASTTSVESLGDGIVLAEVEVNVNLLMGVATKILDLYDRAIRLHSSLMGYDATDSDSMRRPVPIL
jgi:hypothetical protein